MSIVAAAALVLAGILGWAYSNARREAREAQAAAERERLRNEGLIVVDPKTHAQVKADLERLEKQNAKLKVEIERVSKLIPGATVDAAFHIVVKGKVGGEKHGPVAPVKGTGPSGSAVPVGPRRLRFPSFLNPAPRQAPLAAWATLAHAGEPMVRLASTATLAQADVPGDAPPAAKRPGTGRVTVGGAPRGVAGARGGGPAGESKEVAGIGECVLAAGDDAEIAIDEAHLVTEAGNTVVVGTAKMNRITPPPTTVFAATFSTGQLSERRRDEREGKGFGVGLYGAGWDGGGSVGPAVVFPSVMLLGHTLDFSAMVGFGSKLQAGASAIARW
jgi:hypothetical protein